MGIDFTIVSNMTMADKEGYKEDCKEYGIKALHIDLDRNPLGRNNKKAHDELCKIIVMLYNKNCHSILKDFDI